MKCERCGVNYPERIGRFCGACLPMDDVNIKLTYFSKEYLIGIIDLKDARIAELEAQVPKWISVAKMLFGKTITKQGTGCRDTDR